MFLMACSPSSWRIPAGRDSASMTSRMLFSERELTFPPHQQSNFNFCTQVISFLDTTVGIQEGRTQKGSTILKTNRPQTYLHASSYRLNHFKQSVVYSQALCNGCTCSSRSDTETHLKELQPAALQLPNPPDTLGEPIMIPRDSLLQDKSKEEDNNTTGRPLQLIFKAVQHIVIDYKKKKKFVYQKK